MAANNNLPPIPQDPIGENFKWRDWFSKLGAYIQKAQYGDLVWPIKNGGTGSTTAAGARSNLGIGSLGVQNSDNVAITGGSISGVSIPYSDITGLATVAHTGAYSDLTGKPTLGSMAAENSNSVAVTGGSIDGTPIGATSASTGHFTTLTLDTALSIANGGTGATSAADARTNLGLGSGLSVTITTAKLTTGGTNGSMTFINGILTAQTQAT